LKGNPGAFQAGVHLPLQHTKQLGQTSRHGNHRQIGDANVVVKKRFEHKRVWSSAILFFMVDVFLQLPMGSFVS
jgi:hypothetical protein